MKKILAIGVFVVAALTACVSPAASEGIYELATVLSKVTRAVDTANRYGTVNPSLQGMRFISAAVEDKSLLDALEAYELVLFRKGTEVIVLMCEGPDEALLADVGCTAGMDVHYWRQESPVACNVDESLLRACAN